MSRKRPEGIRAYDSPAGGWGALHAVAVALKREQIAVEGTRTLLANHQPAGFDCPGYAWPDPKHISAFEFCEAGGCGQRNPPLPRARLQAAVALVRSLGGGWRR